MALLLFTLAASACSDAEDLDNFDVEVKGQTVIKAGSALEVLLNGFPQLDAFTGFDLSESQAFRNKDYSPDDVDSVVLQTLTLEVTDPDGQDLSFLGSMVVYAETEGLPRKEIARRDDFPEGMMKVSFTTSSDDIKDYVLAREGSLTVDVIDSRRPNQDTTVEMVAVFDVDIRIF